MGTPKSIHLANDKFIPYVVSIAPASNVLGGVPINVDIPPKDAEYAIPNISALPNLKFSSEVSIYRRSFNVYATLLIIFITIVSNIIAFLLLDINIYIYN